MTAAKPHSLALFGGTPSFPEGPPDWPRSDPRILEAMEGAWRDGSWGQYLGPHSDRLRRQLCELHRIDHAMLISSGTIGVELALRGLGVRGGDLVLMSGYDFPGNFRAIEAIGARPLLCDVSPNSFVPSVEIIEHALARSTSPPAAILISHLHGDLVDMPQVMQIAKASGTPVVEDACQAMGGTIEGQYVGTFGDMGVLSFGGSKLITAGRGGALLTSDESALQRCRVFSERGNQAFPFSELQAVVLRPQLAVLAGDTARRAQSAVSLLQLTNGIPGISSVSIPKDTWVPGYFKLGFRFDASKTVWPDREEFLTALVAEGIAAGAGFRGFVKRSSRRCERASELTECARLADQTWVLHHPILLSGDDVLPRVAACIQKVAGPDAHRT